MIEVLFLDMDNTIAENTTCKDVQFTKGMYLSKRPIGFMIDAVNTLLRPNVDLIIILTKVQGLFNGVDEKQRWLSDLEFRYDAFMYISDDTKKSKMMLDFCEANGYKPEECLIIDDKKAVLQDAELYGFNVKYPQQLLVDYYEWIKNNIK